MWALWSYRHLDLNIRPVTLKPSTAITARISRLSADDVLSWSAELRGRGRFSILGGNSRPHVFESHGAWSAKLAPENVCRWALARTCFRSLFSIIRNPN